MKNSVKKNKVRHARSFFSCIKTVFAVLFVLILLLSGATAVYLNRQKELISSLESRIDSIKQTSIPLRFMLLSRSDTSVSARFRFYNADGQELASFERAWNGSELAIDSLVVPVADKYLVFPLRVFTDAIAPGRGTELFPYYDIDGMPAIYDSASMDSKTRQLLRDLFFRVKLSESIYMNREQASEKPGSGSLLSPIPSVYGNAVHDIKQLRSFEVGTVYALLVHGTGGIEIIRE